MTIKKKIKSKSSKSSELSLPTETTTGDVKLSKGCCFMDLQRLVKHH